jgi:purine-binding chemotaxis protein CheW
MRENSGRDEFDDDLYDEDDEDTQKGMFLIFHLGAEDYGIEIRYVIDIVGMQRITDVPDMPDFVRGVINLRGQVIPVLDVRTRFHMDTREYDDRTCIIVVKINETSIGLIVDTVSEVQDIKEDQISPPPKISSVTSSRYILGMGKVGEEVKILLDISTLLFEEEIDKLQEVESVA